MVFQIAALGVLAVFYGCYLYKMLMQRRAGIQTDQMGKGKSGMTKWIEMILKVTTYLTVGVEVASILLNTSRFPLWLRIAGGVLAAAGTAVFILAVYTMKDSWRAGVSHTDQTELVTAGIFWISRNPAFLGFDLVYIGIVLMFFNVPLLAVSVLACLMLHLQIVNNEEPFLLEAFAEQYADYKRHVCRYLGRH